MSSQAGFVNPFCRPQCLAAAAPAGKAKLTHPGKAILAGKVDAVFFFVVFGHVGVHTLAKRARQTRR